MTVRICNNGKGFAAFRKAEPGKRSEALNVGGTWSLVTASYFPTYAEAEALAAKYGIQCEPQDPLRVAWAQMQESPQAMALLTGVDVLDESSPMRHGWRWYFWKFVHNTLIHPFLGLPYEPKWLQDAHDWTAKRCRGGG